MQTRKPISRIFLIYVAVMALALLMFILIVITVADQSDPYMSYNQTARAVVATNTAVQSIINATNTSRATATRSP